MADGAGDGAGGLYTSFRSGPVEVFIVDTRWFAKTEPAPERADLPSLLGEAQFAKVDTEAHPDVAAPFSIRGIPTLMLFKDGQLAATKVGALSKSQLIAFIDQQLA